MRRIAIVTMYAGIVALVVAFSKVHAVWNDYDYSDSRRLAWSMAYIAALAVSAYILGLPDIRRGRSVLGRAVAAAALGALGISVLQLFVGDALLPRVVVFGSAIAVVPLYIVTAWMAARGRARAEGRDRVVVVADPEEIGDLAEEVEHESERPAALDSVLHPTEVASDRRLVGAVQTSGATLVVLSRAAQDDHRIVEQAEALHAAGTRVRSVTRFYEEWLGKLPISELERVSLLFDISEVHGQIYGRVKRLLDLGAGAVGLVLMLIVTPFVLVGNIVASRGPLLFRQQRVGRNGRVFTILKFRSMRPDPGADEHGEWTTIDDPRVTRFGRFLRASRVDELPQMWNILRGDLSIVGPRPEQPQYVERLSEKIPFYDLRHLVRPGLTGWAQVKYRYGASEQDALEKLQYEFFYLRHQGVLLDLRIIGRTLRSLVSRPGR